MLPEMRMVAGAGEDTAVLRSEKLVTVMGSLEPPPVVGPMGLSLAKPSRPHVARGKGSRGWAVRGWRNVKKTR